MSETLSRDCIASFIRDSLRVRASARTAAVAQTDVLDRDLLSSYRYAVSEMLATEGVAAGV